MALRVAGLGSAPRQALSSVGLNSSRPACAPRPGGAPCLLVLRQGHSDSVLPGQGQEDEIQDLGAGPSGATGGLLCFFVLGTEPLPHSHTCSPAFQKFLSKVEETFQCICCQELCSARSRPCQHNVCKVRGGRGAAGVPKGALTLPAPCDGRASLGPPALCSFRGLRVCFRAAWLTVALLPPAFIPVAQPRHHSCAQPHWPSAGPPLTGRFVPTFLGGQHAGLLQHLPGLGSRVERRVAVLLLGQPSRTK